MDRVSITMRKAVVGEDGTDWLAGTTHAASEGFARALVARGAAVPAAPLAPAAPLTTASIENRAAVIDVRDPAPKGRRR